MQNICKFLRMTLNEARFDADVDNKLLDLRTCGLHIMHHAFKHSESKSYDTLLAQQNDPSMPVRSCFFEENARTLMHLLFNFKHSLLWYLF